MIDLSSLSHLEFREITFSDFNPSSPNYQIKLPPGLCCIWLISDADFILKSTSDQDGLTVVSGSYFKLDLGEAAGYPSLILVPSSAAQTLICLGGPGVR
jgi:hypothetical protein